MGVTIYPSAGKHGAEREEVLAALRHPVVRYSIVTAFEDADTYMFIARIGHDEWVEVAAEYRMGAWHVFHAMMLTHRVAREVFAMTEGALDLRLKVGRQRGPRSSAGREGGE
ncbi:hypothetical protein FO059_14920 [Tomitella fengzijianii]|uniref:Uncharacterized protein n=1 Tax=Tomitella fengzijianii TaxID=2597660 RepID=A0A516X5P6_9ACTN|nr:hypothetical protein FO059_14920 [Tomitella fengzijianii]